MTLQDASSGRYVLPSVANLQLQPAARYEDDIADRPIGEHKYSGAHT